MLHRIILFIYLQRKLTAYVLVCVLLADFALNEVTFSEELLDQEMKRNLVDHTFNDTFCRDLFRFMFT